VFDGDASITEGEGLGARGVGVPRVGVFRWAEEPVEGNDGEVDDMTVDLALDRVRGIEDSEEFADDGNVGGVRALGRVVLVGHPFEERLE
jgi:hypothetical protein